MQVELSKTVSERSVANKPYLSVVMPVYQEQDVVRRVITEIVEVLRASPYTFEVIVVDDGSRDSTNEEIRSLHEEFLEDIQLVLVTHPYNKGAGAAIKTGIRIARGEVVVFIDADGQHDPCDILRMLPFISEYDLIVGARRDYQSKWYRRIGNRLFNSLASWLTQFPIEDLTSGYRILRATVIKQYVHLLPARFSFSTTTTLAFIKGGYNVKYLPIDISPRLTGHSELHAVRDGWRFLNTIFKIVVIFEPMRVFFPIALLLFGLGFGSAAYSMWSLGRLIIPNSAVLLSVVAVIVILLGFIAQQITALQMSHHEDKFNNVNDE